MCTFKDTETQAPPSYFPVHLQVIASSALGNSTAGFCWCIRQKCCHKKQIKICLYCETLRVSPGPAKLNHHYINQFACFHSLQLTCWTQTFSLSLLDPLSILVMYRFHSYFPVQRLLFPLTWWVPVNGRWYRIPLLNNKPRLPRWQARGENENRSHSHCGGWSCCLHHWNESLCLCKALAYTF